MAWQVKVCPCGHTCNLVCYVASMIGQAVLACYLLSPIYHILLNRLHKSSYMKLFYYIPIWVLIYFNLFSLHYEPFGGSGNFDFISIFCVLFCFLNAVRGPGAKFLPDRDLAQSLISNVLPVLFVLVVIWGHIWKPKLVYFLFLFPLLFLVLLPFLIF